MGADSKPDKRLVVAGHGPAAHRLVEALRERDAAGTWTITVIGEEPRPAYDRVALTTHLEGADLAYPAHGGGVTVRTGERVTAIDRAARTVTTSAGREEPYDALVLATGSAPFVPPVEGRDLPGVFVYRTIDDLDAIREYARGRTTGAVVGGGLLGLEAARALQGLGLRSGVVEVAPWLMPRQVDEGGGAMLRRHIEALGMAVHAGTPMRALEAGDDGAVRRVVLDGGAEIDAEVVVFSAGIRPRDELARGCGLPVGERGGIVVDDSCRTEDPAVWAIGECALVGGAVHGLVGPCFSMAEVVADRLLSDTSTAVFEGADMSTKLKLMGVDVASFGDPFAGPEQGALGVTYTDPVAGVYKKLLVSDDAQTLLGGVLVGDAESYGTLRAYVGGGLPGAPEQMLFGGTETAGGDLPGATVICSCNNVTAEGIRCAIADHSLTDVPGVKDCTRAGTSCGSCVPLVKRILDAELTAAGIEVSKALCEHFDYSRAELFDIVRAGQVTSFTQLVEEHGTGRGCDICKPAVASILASLGNGHILEGEQAALQDTNDHFLANLQKNGTYSVVPRVPGGEITPEKLIVIGEVARDFGLYTKITGGQRIDLFGARVEQLPDIWRRLVDAGFESGHAYGKALRTVKSCVGSTWCRYGVQDSAAMAIRLELRYRGLRAPHKLKSAVSGCARECAEAQSKDFGVIATENGWNLYLAGNGGMRPRHADLFATDLTDDELITYIDRFLMFYIRTADRLQRTAGWLEALDGGLDYLREVIVDDRLGICADLDAAMERHVAAYSDEWRDTLDDPERLGRFVSFVNAPHTPDPSIAFAVERDQIKPLPLEVKR
ncbi:assimilatory nitrite reductase (NAD(P)H) large subunit precursor [Actinomadura madurae]|uniref:assimilatory sulfite reductase (ferredoxin) n=1 Tax=Actinomadura madurae TaxID=1993 RepID=A0A1I5K109_9ACTN|nr:nitrite reductase large subunit NirB [Actinomadura madurae]SFO78754.1 assimilatory nitrite reductase (NAD(P)H) large subunit precursor [Actinomadura madurae]